MTKEEKKKKRIAKKNKRIKRRRDKKYSPKIAKALNEGLSISQARDTNRNGGYWFDDSSGQYMQVCCYQGICSYPCNGDC